MLCSDISKRSKHYGTPSIFENNGILALLIGSGFVANAAYCMYLLTKVGC
jgi:hypothetical protein